ncbi:hypothetical protein B0H11DRAFT_1916961 [Mycena galericulata]|nr:hypothetical protein B0H11DRAFT_1916961 [Mycena galericulata]
MKSMGSGSYFPLGDRPNLTTNQSLAEYDAVDINSDSSQLEKDSCGGLLELAKALFILTVPKRGYHRKAPPSCLKGDQMVRACTAHDHVHVGWSTLQMLLLSSPSFLHLPAFFAPILRPRGFLCHPMQAVVRHKAQERLINGVSRPNASRQVKTRTQKYTALFKTPTFKTATKTGTAPQQITGARPKINHSSLQVDVKARWSTALFWRLSQDSSAHCKKTKQTCNSSRLHHLCYPGFLELLQASSFLTSKFYVKYYDFLP